MGITKSDQFTKKHNEISVLLKALGHPARVAIISHLLKVQTCICGDLVNELPLAQATISQHLKELKSAGLIKGSVEGKSVCYCIDEKAINTLKAYFETIQFKLNKNNCC
jgi:ArsR family transcriptional regulator